jgi:hypothetical protein
MKCKDCYNLKTLIITRANVSKYPWVADNIHVQKTLKQRGVVRIWFCKKGRLGYDLYTVKTVIMNLTKKGCDEGEN